MKKVTLYLIAVMGMLIALAGCSGSAPVPKGSQPWKNITRTPTPTPTPDPVFLIFEELNGASDENLESTWQSCQKKIAAQNLENEWNAFCDEYSALADYQGSALSRLRTEYGLTLFTNNYMSFDWGPRTTSARKFLEPYVKEKKIKPRVAELLYRPGVMPDLGGTLWLYEEYKEVEETLGKPSERTESEPIRFLLVDCSETIENTPIERELFLSNSSKAIWVRTRSENLVSGLFRGNSAKLRPVSYPELADVVIKITVEYPYNGIYSVTGKGSVKVWNTDATIEAVNRWTNEEISVTFSNKAAQSFSLREVHEEYFMEVPRISDDNRYKDDAAKLAQAILAWFPNVKKPGT